ncbi:MAG: CvpA family protein [Lachnospiraceae bacterium]|nr:CvpA family protein [Lachnospiraceae bacterium]
MEARIAEIIAAVIVLACVLEGAYKGLVLKVYSIACLALLLVIATVLAPLILPMIPEEVVVREGAAFVAALVVTGIALGIVGSLLKIIDHIPVVKQVNRIGGALLGFVFGMLIVWVALFVIGTFQEVGWFQEAAGYIRQSPILMAMEKCNPLPAILKNFDFPSL